MSDPTFSGSLDTSTQTLSGSEFNQALSEYRLMLRYALAEGLELDDKTRAAVAAVVSIGPAAVTAVPLPPDAVEDAGPTPDAFAALLNAHAALIKIVAPATPRSIEATEPVPGRLGSLRRPPLIMWMIVIALVAL